jgi:hypothetical protein
MTSASLQPNMRSATGFQKLTLPSRSIAQIVGGDH